MLETDCKGGFLFRIVTLKLISMVSWALCLCFIFLFVFCFLKLFLIEEWLLYNTGLVSAIPRLAIGTHMSPPSWISSHLPPFPSPPGCYRAPVWVPWVAHEFPLVVCFTVFVYLFGCAGSQLQHADFVAALRPSRRGACGFSCSAARGIFPDQGSNPHPLHYKVNS